MPETFRSFVIRIADETRAPNIFAFHKEYLTEHLWPRTLAEFRELATNGALYEAIETTSGAEDMVGLCYIMHGQEPTPPNAERGEFGGVYVTENCRSLGLASCLGKAAISNHFAWDPPKGRLIAHVHEDNSLPRDLLEKRLGFFRNGEESPPASAVPPSMKRNAGGQVVGHLFEFRRKTLIDFASWIETASEVIETKKGARIRISLPSFKEHKTSTVEALRGLGAA